MTTLFFVIENKRIDVKISPELHEKMRCIASNLKINIVKLARRCFVTYGEINEKRLNQYLESYGPECTEDPNVNFGKEEEDTHDAD